MGGYSQNAFGDVADNQTPTQQPAPAVTIPAGPAPGSTADLEQRAQQNLLASIQQRAASNYQQLQPQAPQVQQWDPDLEPFAQQLTAQLKGYAPDPTPKRGVKGLLSNFLTGFGNAALRETGQQTPDDKWHQALQEYTQLGAEQLRRNTERTQAAYTEALTAGTQQRTSQSAQLFPGQLYGQGLQNQSLAYNVQQQQATVHPAMSAQDLQGLGLSQNIAQQFSGKPLNSADMQALIQMGSLAGQNQKVFDYGQDGKGANKGIWLVDRQYNPIKQLSPISETGRSTALAKQQIALMGQMAKTGYAYDPATQQTVLTSAGEARQNNYQAFRPVTEANIRNDTHDSQVLNDIATKTNNVARTAKALDQGTAQTAIIAQAISAADKDSQFRLGAFGTTIPTGWFNNLMNQTGMQFATQQTRDYIVALLSLRESAMGMQRLLTGSARSNESQIQALQQTLPGLEPDSGLALQKLQSFGQNLQMLRGGIPRLPGIQSVPLFNPSEPLEPGQSINAPLPSDFEAPIKPESTSLGYIAPVSYRGTPQDRRLRRLGLLRT